MLEIFEIAAKAVADPTRIRILKLLQSGELCVCQLTTVLGLAPATVSKHLSVLKGAGLVQSRRDGKWVYYRLAETDFPPHARRFLDLLAVSLGDDPTIAADKALMLQVNAVPLQVLCDQGRAALPETLSQAAPSCCGATP
ncbi:MAG: winged helix-turn-helix transcriptional regulator [Magnetospirillum gryphiswaldense]|nr:winged helix-turn-helix transcriptional regulator [Magnetospirillum gryphiswaldense]